MIKKTLLLIRPTLNLLNAQRYVAAPVATKRYLAERQIKVSDKS